MPRQKKQRLKKRKDGRYVAVYQGKQFMGDSEDEALAKREEYKRQEARGIFIKQNRQTLSEYVAYWLPIYKSDVKASTYNAYVSILTKTIQPIADKQLKDISSDDIAATFSALSKLSASYIHKAKILLTEIMDSAVDACYILHNPCRAKSVKTPKGKKGSHRALKPEEIMLIRTVPHRMQLAALVMLYCGLRRGEVLGLSSKDIRGDMVTVSRAISYISNQPIVSDPKTKAGKRCVPIPSILKPYLDNLSGLVYSGSNGSYATEQAFSRGWESYIKALSTAAGKPVNIRPHDLRHTYCTMLRDAGVDMHQAIIWMGHTDEKMILRIYDHPDTLRQNEAKNRLNSLLNMQNDMQMSCDETKTTDITD